MATTPFIEREDYDRFLEQEASHFPRATKEAVARLITSSLPDEVQWVADSACEYPEDLFLVDQPPRVLVYEGDLSLLGRQVRLVVAGSRHASEACRADTESLCQALASHGVFIVSGMLSNIDMAAHEGSLRAENPDPERPATSGAIVCSPFGAPWPKGRRELGHAICDAGGVVVSLVPQVRGLALDEKERLEVLSYRQQVFAAIGTAILIVYLRPNGVTETLIQKALDMERPVLLWHSALEEKSPYLEELLANPPKDEAGRELLIIVKSVEEIEAAISAWQLVWWL